MNFIRLSELGGEWRNLQGYPNPVLTFTCPTCSKGKNDQGEYTGHSIMVSFAPPSLFPSGAIWQKDTNDLAMITVMPSINCDTATKDPETGEMIPSNCKFHGWIKHGSVCW